MNEIEIPEHPNYYENHRRIKGNSMPCVVCGKGVSNPKYSVHIHHGGSHLVTEQRAEELNATEESSADMGGYPLGAECYRNHPELRPFVTRIK